MHLAEIATELESRLCDRIWHDPYTRQSTFPLTNIGDGIITSKFLFYVKENADLREVEADVSMTKDQLQSLLETLR
jgi:hypothetical protein